MRCLLIFDHLNDLVYSKYDRKFLSHIKEFALDQGLIKDGEVGKNCKLSSNIIVQIFSPVIASQRIMNCQFGNSYTTVQCEDDLTIAFDEYMGYLFVGIGLDDVTEMKRYLSVCITLVRYLCGPDVIQLRDKPSVASLVTKLINSWTKLHKNDQAILVEAVEQLVINADLSSATLKSLKSSVEKLTSNTNCSKIHALVMVQNKFFSLYSSQNAKELSSADIIFLTILLNSKKFEDNSIDDEEYWSPSPILYETQDNININSYKVLLAGPQYNPQCLPYIVHIVPVNDAVNVIYLLEIGNPSLASSLYEMFCHFHTLQFIQIQRDTETMRPAIENLEIATKKLTDSLKKNKNPAIDSSYKQLIKKWDMTKKKYQEFIKTSSDEALLRGETLALGFLENLKHLLNLTAIDESAVYTSRSEVMEASKVVCDKLHTFDDFLKAKAVKNFSLGSRDSLTINKYLEEFPGLVHFIYIDRSNHRITAPSLEFTSEESGLFTNNKIWQMVKFSQTHLQDGTLSLIWKDTIFNYTYFVWFEDLSGGPLKPTVYPASSSRLPIPGLFCVDFYQKLKEICFPKMAPSKIRCYELFCIHLGLVTASCVLEHTRRLAATVWELKGHPNHPIDLL